MPDKKRRMSRTDAATRQSLLVLIPAYNEATRLPQVLAEVRAALPAALILVVDDGSTDGTAEAAQGPRVRVVRHPFNLGYGAALQTGYRYARAHGWDRLAQMDADGQHCPQDLPGLLEALEREGADLVVGSRFLAASGAYPMPIARRAGQAYLRCLAGWLGGTRFSDPTSGFQVLGVRALELCAQDGFPGDYPDADVLAMLCLAGLKVVDAPVAMRPRSAPGGMHAGPRWVYYLFRMTLGLLAIPLGRTVGAARSGSAPEPATAPPRARRNRWHQAPGPLPDPATASARAPAPDLAGEPTPAPAPDERAAAGPCERTPTLPDGVTDTAATRCRPRSRTR